MDNTAKIQTEPGTAAYGFTRWHGVVVLWVLIMFALPPLKGGFAAKAMLLPFVGPYSVFFMEAPPALSGFAIMMIAAGTTLLALGILAQTMWSPIRLQQGTRLTIWFFSLSGWCTAGYLAVFSMMG
jgi:hypothetical protein